MADELLPVEDVIRFCRNPEQFGDGTAAFTLRTKRPKWFLVNDLPWMPRPRLESVIQEASDGWDAVADVHASRASTQAEADWIFTTAQMDGPMGVLADAQLPSPGLRQQVCRIDIAEQALADVLVVILRHEIGHLWGLQHFSSAPPPELMEPKLNKAITNPQPAESALMAQWYGMPQPSVPTMPSVPMVCTLRVEPSSGEIKCAISVQQGTKKAELAGTKSW